jgi:hypothetical protein
MDQLVRARLDRLAKALRQFRLTDGFGLEQLLSRETLPTVEEIRKKIARSRDLLPPSITPEYLAEAVAEQLIADEQGYESLQSIDAALTALARIPAGREAAHRYHDQAIELLRLLFDGQLRFEGKNVPQDGGRGLIDILCRNVATSGVFHSLTKVHGIPCPFVPVECKNYKEDVSNDEFQQLRDRLDDNIGHVGMMMCRTIVDAKAVQERYRPAKKGLYVFVLTDVDLGRMRDQLRSGRHMTVMEEKLRALLLA